MRRSIFFGSLAVGLALLLTATAARADQWSKTFPVTAKPNLTLDADNAALNIVPGGAHEVAVRVSVTGWKIPQDVRVTQTQNGNDIRVKVTQVRHSISFSHGSVTVDVTVPPRADLALSTSNGSITIGAVDGTLHAGTSNGRIRTNRMRGAAYLHSGNGRIEALNFDGSLQANTGNGSVHVSGRFDALDVRSGRGGIDAVVDLGSKMSSDWRISTGVGNVTVSLPSNFSAELQASTGVGHVTADFPVTVSGSFVGSSVRGRVGKGGAMLRVETGVGSINIERTGS